MAKLAEKLIVLQEAGKGLLTRLHQWQAQYTNPETKPTFLTDPSYSKILAAITRKFPDVDFHTERVRPFGCGPAAS